MATVDTKPIAGVEPRAMLRGLLRRHRRTIVALAFLSPWLIGFLVFTLYPILASLYYSFTDMNLLNPPRWIGFSNYRLMLTGDPAFWQAMYNTVYFVVISVPLSVAVALGLALLLNASTRLRSVYRTAVFLPTMVPPVASAILWLWLLNPQDGLINQLLGLMGIPGPGWFSSPTWAKPGLIVMSLWGVGTWAIILLAGLQSVPQHLYEAAALDGARVFQKFRHVTVPMLSPVLFFNLVMGLIGGFQYFAQVYIIGGGEGAPAGSLRFYSLYLFNLAFGLFKMGYASALAWVLFLLILLATLLVFGSVGRSIYYEGR